MKTKKKKNNFLLDANEHSLSYTTYMHTTIERSCNLLDINGLMKQTKKILQKRTKYCWQYLLNCCIILKLKQQ